VAAKEWQIVLDKAKAYGWKDPIETTAHKKTILKCPEEVPSCTIQIFGSGSNSEDAAQTYIQKIDRCPHRKMADPLAKVDAALKTADRLISGAERMVARDKAQDLVNDLLEQALQAVGEAASELEKEMYQADEEQAALAQEAAAHLGSDPDQTTVANVVGEAGSHLRTAELTLRELPKRADPVVERKATLELLIDRLEELRA
jgi:hypothetical protein